MKKYTRSPFIRELLASIFTLIVMLSNVIDPDKGLTDPSVSKIQRDVDYGSMPLFFIPNQGQFDERVKHTAQGKDKSINFTTQGLTFVLSEQVVASPSPDPLTLREIYPQETSPQASQKRWVINLHFAGVNHNTSPESLEKAETLALISRPAEGMEDPPADQLQDHLPQPVAGHRSGILRHGESSEARLHYPHGSRPGADPGLLSERICGTNRYPAILRCNG